MTIASVPDNCAVLETLAIGGKKLRSQHAPDGAPMKPAIIIPTFNHAPTVAGVIAQVHATLAGGGGGGDGSDVAPEIIVINDGSTDATASILSSIPGVTRLTHARNRGKGAALATAFAYAQSRGCTHAVTVDADGQHLPNDVARLLSVAREHPRDLILGQRDMDSIQVPTASKKGRDASRFWLRLETGQDIPDSQCGLRVYPLDLALAVPRRFDRYDFETEILARLAWGGVRIRNVPVACIYQVPPHRITHFRPVIDTLRGIRAHMFLVFRRLLPLPFRRLTKDVAAPSGEFGRWWKWTSWRDALRKAFHAGSSNSELAMAFAMGIFVGLFLVFFFLQTILAIYLARRMHLNVIAAVVGSQISIPPLFPLWFALSCELGNFLVHGRWAIADAWTWSLDALMAFVLGNLVLAAMTAALGWLAARGLLYWLREEPQLAPVAA